MPVLALGVSYRHADVELLERLSFGAEDYPKAYRRVLEMDAVREAVILSTCNRVEVYGEVTSYHAGFQDLKRFLAESREISADEFVRPLYSHYEDDAAEHVFAVAAGIDSMVLGEPQILSQVRQAHRRAQQEDATGSALDALFQRAIRTGRRARRETGIGAAPGAFVEAAANLAASELGDLAGRVAVVVGAGDIASLAARHLRARGVRRLFVVNRSVERAERLAALVSGEARGLDGLGPALAQADLVISSTGATGPVIGPEVLAGAARCGREWTERPLFVADLAVPRDVDPAAADTPGVRVAGLDDLRGSLGGQDRRTQREVTRVRAIVRDEVERFASWRRQARVAPLIEALRERGDSVRAAELARVAPRLSGLSERERDAVEALAQGIVAKLLHDPIVKVKELTGPGGGDAHARALAALFGIDFRPGQ